jgi:hypothetical protein
MKHIAISVLLAISVLSLVWYSSCSKDNCKSVNCLNDGTCSGGICVCDSGTGGNNCEVVYRVLYANTYTGFATINFNVSDTTDKNHTDTNNTLVFTYGSDTLFNKMQVAWHDTSSTVTLPIILSNNTSSGSDFTITGPVTVGSFSYTGSGFVSTNLASLTLIQTPVGGGAAITINLTNLTK